MKNVKTLLLVILGNIIDYYDFLLFAHLGYIITPEFIPNLSSKEAHLLSLLLFALPFIVRPLGGYLFGRLSDTRTRIHALGQSLKWASMATIGIAFLPSYHDGGLLCACLFVMLRGLQGVSLGGEYPTAGTFLMERYSQRQGLVSGILAGSGTVGSLIAFAFAWAHANAWVPQGSWRMAFFIGGTLSFMSYLMRRALVMDNSKEDHVVVRPYPYVSAVLITVAVGVLVGVTTWLPMTYSNFYLTKILGADLQTGLEATFISLVAFVLLTPVFGEIADRYGVKSVMTISALCVIPLGIVGFALIQQQCLVGQLFLTLGAASFGAPIHVLMNQLFPKGERSRNVNLFFMTGTAIGSLAPVVSGYLTDVFHVPFIPVILLSVVGFSVFVLFYKFLLNELMLKPDCLRS